MEGRVSPQAASPSSFPHQPLALGWGIAKGREELARSGVPRSPSPPGMGGEVAPRVGGCGLLPGSAGG